MHKLSIISYMQQRLFVTVTKLNVYCCRALSFCSSCVYSSSKFVVCLFSLDCGPVAVASGSELYSSMVFFYFLLCMCLKNCVIIYSVTLSTSNES